MKAASLHVVIMLMWALISAGSVAAPVIYRVSPLDLRPDNGIPADWAAATGPIHVRIAPGELDDIVVALAGGDEAIPQAGIRITPLRDGSRELRIPEDRLYAVVCYYGPKGGINGPKEKEAPESYQYEPFALFYDAGIVQVDHAARRTRLTQEGFLVDPPPLKAREVPAGEMRQWYVTIPVPPDAAPGSYSGQLEFTSRGAVIASVPLAVEVLPIRLLPPAKIYAMYNNIYDLGIEDPRYLLMLKDLAEHGFDTTNVMLEPHKGGGEPFGRIDQTMELIRQAGMDPEFTFAFSSAFINFWDSNPEKDQKVATELKRHWDDKGYAPLAIYGMDEASGDTLRRVAKRYQTVRDAGLKVLAACSEGFFEQTGDNLDIPILAGGLVPSDLAVADVARAKAAGLTILSYSGPQLIYRAPLLYRVRTGFNLWTSIYDGWCPFTYAWDISRHQSGEIITAGCGSTYKDHGVVIVGKERMISQVEWPAMRQGVDDVRFATTLAAQVMAARRLELQADAVDAAEAFLRKPGVSAGDYLTVEAARARIVDFILQLQALAPGLDTIALAGEEAQSTARAVNDWIRPDLSFRPFPMGQKELAEGLERVRSQLAAGRGFEALQNGYALDRQVDELVASGKLSPVEKVIAKGEIGKQILATEAQVLGVNPADLPETFTVVAEISDGWRFQPDREDVGLESSWYAPDHNREEWSPIDTQTFWQRQGNPDWIDLEGAQIGALGIGWYARALEVPESWGNRSLYLWFKVDEDAMVWIDGKLVRIRNEGSMQERWNVPTIIELSPHLSPGTHQLVIRVFNDAMAGGLWQGVRIIERK